MLLLRSIGIHYVLNKRMCMEIACVMSIVGERVFRERVGHPLECCRNVIKMSGSGECMRHRQ